MPSDERLKRMHVQAWFREPCGLTLKIAVSSQRSDAAYEQSVIGSGVGPG